jgi:hypothetical protein
MAYTVSHLYNKVLDGVDKIGSDLYTLEYVIDRLEAAAYDFIGETVKYIENTQEIRDDIRTLYKPFNLDFVYVHDTPGTSIWGVVLPTDYQHLMSAVVIDEETSVRDTRLLRHGQLEIQQMDPNTKATAEYPILVLYNNWIKVYSPGKPIRVNGMYVSKPDIWNYNETDDTDVQIAINLPDHTVDKLIKDVINDIFVSSGDPRGQVQFQVKEQYRKRGNS